MQPQFIIFILLKMIYKYIVKTNKQMNILPNEILSQIAGELKGKDIVNFFLTSKRFYSICDYVFWKNKIFKEFPQTQICEDLKKEYILPKTPYNCVEGVIFYKKQHIKEEYYRNEYYKKEYLKNFFGFFTLILMERCGGINMSLKTLFNCKIDILMTNYSTDREEALSTIKKELIPTICSTNFPETNIISLSPSYLLKYNDTQRLLNGSVPQYTTDYLPPSVPFKYQPKADLQIKDLKSEGILSNSINSKEFLSIKSRNQEYYKYIIFGQRVKCNVNTPRKIFAFVVSYTYLWFDNKCCKTLSETILIFLDFFETRDGIIEFVNGYGIRHIISDFCRIDREKNILKNGDEYGYIISRLPLELKEKNKVVFDTDILFDKYHRQTNFEIIEMPLENRKTLKSKHYRPKDILFNL